MSVLTTWECTLCKRQAFVKESTSLPKNWNTITLHTIKVVQDYEGQTEYTYLHLCDECSMMLRNADSQDSFFKKLKEKLGMK